MVPVVTLEVIWKVIDDVPATFVQIACGPALFPKLATQKPCWSAAWNVTVHALVEFNVPTPVIDKELSVLPVAIAPPPQLLTAGAVPVNLRSPATVGVPVNIGLAVSATLPVPLTP